MTKRFSEFESGQQSFRQSAGMILRMGWFNRGSNPQVGQNQLHGLETGRNPKQSGAEGSARQRNPKAALRTPDAFGVPAGGRWSPAPGSTERKNYELQHCIRNSCD